MGNTWAWPSTRVTGDATLAAMTALGTRLAALAETYQGAGHPLEITHDLEASYQPEADELTRAATLAEPMPRRRPQQQRAGHNGGPVGPGFPRGGALFGAGGPDEHDP